MNRAAVRSTRAPADKPAARPVAGPTPIDPRLLKHVSGGAPKGGWACEPLASPNCEAPKGGW